MKDKEIAFKYDVSINTVRSWKTRYKYQGNKKQKRCAHKNTTKCFNKLTQ